MLICNGCSQEDASESLSEVETSAEQAADKAGAVLEKGKDIAKKAAAEGKEIASALGDKAMGFLNPIKEQLGTLDDLKESPEKLKEAVTKLISAIDQKAEGITLPETVSKTLASVKEQLLALKKHLEGEYEQAKINEHVQRILESVKSGLGLTGN